MSDELVKVDRPDPPAEIGVSIIKGVLGAVPVVGQALMEVLFDYRSRIKQGRINFLLQEISNEIRSQGELKVDFEYLKSEEFSDHLENLIHQVASNASQTKRAYYKLLLLATVQGWRPPELSKLFLNILGMMTDDEVMLFSYMYKIHDGTENFRIHGQDARWFFPQERINEVGLSIEQFRVLTIALASKGLVVSNENDVAFGQYAAMNWSHSRITPMGLQFYDYIVAK